MKLIYKHIVPSLSCSLLLLGCGAGADLQPQASLELAPLGGQEPLSDREGQAPPSPPAEWRHLWPTQEEEAVAPFMALRAGGLALDARAQLSSVYRERGYAGASHFFEWSLRFARGEALSADEVRSLIGWETHPGRPQTLEHPVPELLQWIEEERFEEAANRALRLLEREPRAQELALVWANAIAKQSLWDPSKVSPDLLERSFRLLLTATESQVSSVPGTPSGFGLYSWLSNLFVAGQDQLSAATAAAFALAFDQNEPIGLRASELARKGLCERLQVRGAAPRAPLETWCPGCCP
jgi:hypothetical protein